jgi:hypothetical protein
MIFSSAKRVRFLRGIADVRGTYNTGDVAELPSAWARDEIAAGRAIATDAPVGQAVSVIAMMECPRCGTENGEFDLVCSTCQLRFV